MGALIFKLKGANFSENSLGVLDYESMDRLAQSVINKFSISATAEKIALNNFISTIRTAGILSKIKYLSFPCFASDLNGAIFNMINNYQTVILTDAEEMTSNTWDGIGTDTDYIKFENRKLKTMTKTLNIGWKWGSTGEGISWSYSSCRFTLGLQLNNMGAYNMKVPAVSNDVRYWCIRNSGFLHNGTTQVLYTTGNTFVNSEEVLAASSRYVDGKATDIFLYKEGKLSLNPDPDITSADYTKNYNYPYSQSSANAGTGEGTLKVIGYGDGLTETEFDTLVAALKVFNTALNETVYAQ